MSNKPPKTKVDELKEALQAKKDAEIKAADNKAAQHDAKKEEHHKKEEEFGKKICGLETALKECNEKMLRIAAEADNFKKRLSREHAELTKYGHEKLVKELLPILDSLEKVLEHCPCDAHPDVKAFVEGVDLINKQFKCALSKFDLREVGEVNEKFDPNIHEAVSHLHSCDYSENTVMAVHRKGYIIGEKLIRPAMVSVSKGEPQDEEDLTEKVETSDL